MINKIPGKWLRTLLYRPKQFAMMFLRFSPKKFLEQFHVYLIEYSRMFHVVMVDYSRTFFVAVDV
eukprot:1157173-Pelagomonas_calceolata.AAC.3